MPKEAFQTQTTVNILLKELPLHFVHVIKKDKTQTMKNIFKSSLILALISVSFNAYSQKMKFKVDGMKDTTVFLAKYWGKRLFYEDTAVIKNGIVEFTAKPDLKPGMLAVIFPGQKFFEFIYNKEEVSLETKSPDFVTTMVVKKSTENKLFFPYIQYLGSQRTKALKFQEELKKMDKTSEAHKTKSAELEAISKEVLAYQNKLVADNPNTFTAKMVKMSMDIVLPEAPKNEKGIITDSNYVFKYFKKHFWDNTDLKYDGLVNTNIFENKLDQYLGKTMILQDPDTILAYALPLCNGLTKGSEMFKFCVDHITNEFGKSNIMGMDKVYLYMLKNYYCTRDANGKSPAFWMTEDKLTKACEDLDIKIRLVKGAIPPNITLPDTTDMDGTWRDFYSLKNEYTILYFWDPECGHCKKTTPKLQELYAKKLKARNVEIFAVGKATGEDFEKWKKYIKDQGLTFINVGLTKKLFEAVSVDAGPLVRSGKTDLNSLNYHKTYDIFATPRIFLLDKNKKIIAKQLTISQLEDLLDHLQNIKDAEKLFPYDPEEEENMQQH